ncbi:branchpoint-bridging protein [Cyclospora cayetanensis]|uniref:Branchpoint-bridging protein n=1 Tax=Cyclospora cayetanensis TaxID=88456 RepID=A0A6P6RVR6_9EIME|nr:branchpoint-bridging protein [Cyclospora cayetanensis]
MSWLFGGAPSAPTEAPANTDKALPELPPGLQTLPPPPAPKGVMVSSAPFTGFSEPPPSPPVSTGASRGSSAPFSFSPSTKGIDYNSEDFSKYT